ncbi:MAG TPA: Hsp33 family molecular chaperone HslO [Clostridiales bacterium]|jgi:molecular chaperone Hsp33|nr:Hsp33 family molecular chaperone HslO [Clostridiales bacterium]
MKNAIIAIEPGGAFRVYLAITNRLVAEAVRLHRTTPLATAALGRVLTGAGLMGLMLKEPEHKLTVQFKGDGPAGEILATAAGNGEVKGYISNPDVDLPLKAPGKLDVGAAVGQGRLTVIRDTGQGEPYVGRINISTGEIAEDLTMYYFLSEQQSTAVALGVRIETDSSVGAAGGMIIQMLPGASAHVTDSLETLLAQLPPFTEILHKIITEGASLSDKAMVDRLLESIFSGLPEEYRPEIIKRCNISWHCGCSMERLEQVLLSLGREELEQMKTQDRSAEMVCQFCGKHYHFDEEHLAMLLRVAVKAEEIKEKRKRAATKGI